MTKILALDAIHECGLALLREYPGLDLVHLPDPTETNIAEHIRDAEILILRNRCLKREHFENARALRLVSRHGVGCDNLDFEYLRSRGITVAVTADANYVSVAEHAVMLMLAACRNLVNADRAVRSGAWGRRDRLGTRDVIDSAVLVVGFGRIGRAFAERVLAFGADVSVYDPYQGDGAGLPMGVTRAEDLEPALEDADIVSLHLPRTSETEGLFGADLLARLRPGAILVNTCRGGIVDETALLRALDEGRPAIYATDVLAQEPPQDDDPLLQRNDVILTPHSAAVSAQGAIRMATGSCQNALDFIDGCLPPRMVALAPGPRGSGRGGY